MGGHSEKAVALEGLCFKFIVLSPSFFLSNPLIDHCHGRHSVLGHILCV